MIFITEETPQTAVGNLAMALGFLIARGGLSPGQLDCYVESVVVLGKRAGLKRDDFRCFDVTAEIVDRVWDKY